MKLGVFEVPIETIYINDNAGSHFNPVRDAFRIYLVIFKYLFSSITSFAVDYALYWLCLWFGLSGFISYALARLVSSQVNYSVLYDALDASMVIVLMDFYLRELAPACLDAADAR